MSSGRTELAGDSVAGVSVEGATTDVIGGASKTSGATSAGLTAASLATA
jgi:hypothetical protein